MSESLKICPFCSNGGDPFIQHSMSKSTSRFQARCAICGARTDICNSKKMAAAKWNSRFFEIVYCQNCVYWEMNNIEEPLHKMCKEIDYDGFCFWGKAVEK